MMSLIIVVPVGWVSSAPRRLNRDDNGFQTGALSVKNEAVVCAECRALVDGASADGDARRQERGWLSPRCAADGRRQWALVQVSAEGPGMHSSQRPSGGQM